MKIIKSVTLQAKPYCDCVYDAYFGSKVPSIYSCSK